jgi:hypothetical protein
MLTSLGNSGYLTQEIFTQFQTDAQSQFDSLMLKTNDASLAYQMMGPELAKLAWYASQYGYQLDSNTEEMIRQASAHGVKMDAMIPPEEKMVALMESLVTVLGGDIPYATDTMQRKAKASIEGVQHETEAWVQGLKDAKDELQNELPGAVSELDEKYKKHMTGNSVVPETYKWKHSLEEVDGILGRDLLESADNLDKKYRHVSGNIYEHLQKTSKAGFMARLSFSDMVSELDRLKNSYDKLALKKHRNTKQEGMMEDYSRQIKELSEAIEETAPTLENFGKKFKEFQDQLSGNIGVNRGMIAIASSLREQGRSLKEIDDIIGGALTEGSKGMAAWVETLGTTRSQVEEVKKLEEEYLKLKSEIESKPEAEQGEKELDDLDKMEHKLEDLRKYSQQLMTDDLDALKQSQELMVAYFHSLQAEGKSVSEAMEIMGDGFEALAAKTGGGAGLPLAESFSGLYDLQRKMAGNETLVKGIEGLGDALRGMGDSMLYMSDETFAGFESSAVTAFEKLKLAGFEQEQSLQLIAPMLHDLKSYAEEYGFSLTGGTKQLLSQARDAGALREKQKSDTEKLIEVNENLVYVMDRFADSLEKVGTLSPFAALADEADELEKKTARMKHYQNRSRGLGGDILVKQEELKDLEAMAIYAQTAAPDKVEDYLRQAETKHGEIDALISQQERFLNLYERTKKEVETLREEYNRSLPGGTDYISAALGYHGVLGRDRWFQLHKGERVDVWSPDETRRLQATPSNRMNLSDGAPSKRGGDIVFEHITIQSEDGEEVVRDFMTAIKGNKYGVTNLIKKVAQ